MGDGNVLGLSRVMGFEREKMCGAVKRDVLSSDLRA